MQKIMARSQREMTDVELRMHFNSKGKNSSSHCPESTIKENNYV